MRLGVVIVVGLSACGRVGFEPQVADGGADGGVDGLPDADMLDAPPLPRRALLANYIAPTSTLHLVEIDTGTTAVLGDLGARTVTGLTWTPEGELLGASYEGELIGINLDPFKVTLLAGIPAGFVGFEVAANGLIGVSETTGDVYGIERMAPYQATQLGGLSLEGQPLAVSGGGLTRVADIVLLWTNGGSGGLFSLEGSAATRLAVAPGADYLTGLTFVGAELVGTVRTTNEIVFINPNTGIFEARIPLDLTIGSSGLAPAQP